MLPDPAPAPVIARPPPWPPAPATAPATVRVLMLAVDFAENDAAPAVLTLDPSTAARTVLPMSLNATDAPTPIALPPPWPPANDNATAPEAESILDPSIALSDRSPPISTMLPVAIMASTVL